MKKMRKIILNPRRNKPWFKVHEVLNKAEEFYSEVISLLGQKIIIIKKKNTDKKILLERQGTPPPHCVSSIRFREKESHAPLFLSYIKQLGWEVRTCLMSIIERTTHSKSRCKYSATVHGSNYSLKISLVVNPFLTTPMSQGPRHSICHCLLFLLIKHSFIILVSAHFFIYLHSTVFLVSPKTQIMG